jgi:hypothetical protein
MNYESPPDSADEHDDEPAAPLPDPATAIGATWDDEEQENRWISEGNPNCD